MTTQYIHLINDLNDACLLPGTFEDAIESQSFVYLFEDNLPICARWLQTAECLSLDGCTEDISGFPETARLLYAEAMLRINGIAMQWKAFSLQLDATDMVALSRRISIAGLSAEQFCDEVYYVMEQCRAVRQTLCMAIAYPESDEPSATAEEHS